jgi:hypothetical protein
MRALQLLLLLFIYAVSAEAASPADQDRTPGKNALWQSEYLLARTPQIYLIFDLSEKKVLIKAKGLVLRELPIESYSVWGTPVQPKLLPLISKSALLKPKRAELKPAQKDENNSPVLQALQVEDMPARYRLNFAGGIRIYVRPESEGALLSLANLFSSLKSHLFIRPIGFLWNKLSGENFIEIAVYLKEKDAKSLYWAFQEGFTCIIWRP